VYIAKFAAQEAKSAPRAYAEHKNATPVATNFLPLLKNGKSYQHAPNLPSHQPSPIARTNGTRPIREASQLAHLRNGFGGRAHRRLLHTSLHPRWELARDAKVQTRSWRSRYFVILWSDRLLAWGKIPSCNAHTNRPHGYATLHFTTPPVGLGAWIGEWHEFPWHTARAFTGPIRRLETAMNIMIYPLIYQFRAASRPSSISVDAVMLHIYLLHNHQSGTIHLPLHVPPSGRTLTPPTAHPTPPSAVSGNM